jgi:hypothetical protein
MSNLHFDQHQFAGRRIQPVEAQYTSEGWSSNGIAFEDYERMSSRSSSVPLRHRRWTPAFAASNEKLQKVLKHRAWFYLHGCLSAATQPGDWKTLNAAATKKALESKVSFRNCSAHKRVENEAHMAAVKQAGGYLELQAAIAYRAWRLGQDSCAIAETLGMSPQGVRVNLQRICEVARKLGYDTFSRHFSFGRLRPKRERRPALINSEHIITLYKEGKNVSEIAQAIGYEKNHGNNRVRHALMKAGIYKGRAHHVN